MHKNLKPFTRCESNALKFVHEYFQLSNNCGLNRNTRLVDLTNDLHGAINFSFALENKYSIELTDDEGELIALGTIADYLKIMRSRRLLNTEMIGVLK